MCLFFFFFKTKQKYVKLEVHVPTALSLSPQSQRPGPHPLALPPVTGNSVPYAHFRVSSGGTLWHTLFCSPPRSSPCPLASLGHRKHAVGPYVSVLSLRGGHGDSVFCCYKYLHSSPSFQQAHVVRILTTGGHMVTGSLCDLEGICAPFHAPNISCTPSVCQGPPGSRRVRSPSPQQQHRGAQLPCPPAAWALSD